MSLVIKEYTFSGLSAIVDLPSNASIPRVVEYTGSQTRVWIEVDAPDNDGATFQMSFVIKKQFESAPDNTYTFLGSYWNGTERLFVYYKGL
jgi:hypothetical protein